MASDQIKRWFWIATAIVLVITALFLTRAYMSLGFVS